MTHPDDRTTTDARQARLLARFLDDLGDGSVLPPAGLDPDLSEMALVARDLVSPSPSTTSTTTPTVRRAGKARTWEHLMSTHAPAGPIDWGSDPVSVPRPATRPDPDRRHREARLRLVRSAGAAHFPPATTGPGTRTPQRRWRRRGWPLIELLSVAALIIGIVSVLIGGSGGGQNGDRPAVIPPLAGAGAGTATPEPGSDEVAALPDPGQTGVMPGPGLTGEPDLVWRVPIEAVTSDLFVGDDTVVRGYFSDEIPADFPATRNPWHVEAFSARAGTPVWDTEIAASGVQIGGVWQGTVVLVATGEGAPISIGGEAIGETDQGYVIGLDLATGQIQWSTLLADEPAVQPTVGAPTVTDGIAFVPTSLGQVAAIDLVDGSIVWTATVDEALSDEPYQYGLSPLAVGDGVVATYSMATGKAYALDAATGESRWALAVADAPTPIALGSGADGLTASEPVPSIGGPAIAGGRVYVSIGWYSGDADQSLMAIDLAAGTALWTDELGTIDLSDPNRQRGVSQPFVTDGAAIVSIGGPEGNRLLAFDPETGDPLWEHGLSDEQSSTMSIVDDTGYVAGTNGVLTGIDLASGTERWSVALGGGATRAPFVIDGMLYLAAEDGQLYALGSGSGAAIPDTTPDISGLPTCDVAPRTPADEVFAAAAERTPASTLVEPAYLENADGTRSDILMPAVIAWDDLPVGTPTDATVVAAIRSTVDGVTTCTRAGDPAQVAAYFSDDFFSRPYALHVASYGGFEGYFWTSEIPVMSSDVRLLDDGQAAMIVTDGLISREIGQNEGRLYVFAEQPDGRWLIDEVVIVNDSGLAPLG